MFYGVFIQAGRESSLNIGLVLLNKLVLALSAVNYGEAVEILKKRFGGLQIL